MAGKGGKVAQLQGKLNFPPMGGIPGARPAPVSKIVFKKYCQEGTETIGFAEFQNLCYDMGNFLSKDQANLAIKIIDKDGNGTIEYDEFVDWWSREDRWGKLNLDEEQLTKLQNASKYFRFWDKDSSGSIDRAEFVPLHADLVKNGLTKKDADSCLEDLDSNRDGEIQFNEYVDWLVRLGAIPIKVLPEVAKEALPPKK